MIVRLKIGEVLSVITEVYKFAVDQDSINLFYVGTTMEEIQFNGLETELVATTDDGRECIAHETYNIGVTNND